MKHLFFLASFFLLSLPSMTHAAVGDIFISEVAWSGSSISNADEWIELVNLTMEDISLVGWSLAGAGTSGSALVFPDEAIISASSTFMIANYEAVHENSALMSEPNWATTAVSLSNSSLEIFLVNADGVVVDSVGDGSAPPAGHSGESRASMSRLLQVDAEGLEWETSVHSNGFKEGILDLGSPGSFALPVPEETPEEAVPEIEPPTEPSLPEPTDPEPNAPEEEPRRARPNPLVTAIRISEVYPAPLTGDNEWIELVNTSSIGEFVDGWTIEDEKGGLTLLEGLILPWKRIVITSPKGTLNNMGDIVLLKDAQGRVIDGMSYGTSFMSAFPHVQKVARGSAIIRPEFGERFVITTTPTPGEANIEDPHPEPVADPAPTSKVPLPTRPTPPPLVTTPPVAILAANKITPKISSGVRKLTQTAKPVSVPKMKVTRSRYKGLSYTARIAVPPGVYGKTRMRVIIDGQLHALHLTKTPTGDFHAGSMIGFVAQKKESGGSEFLLANVNSLYHLEDGKPFEFLESESWPASSGTYRMRGEVRSVDGRSMRLDINGKDGVIFAPQSLSGRGIEEGDRVEVLGFFSPGTIPELVMPNSEALRALAPVTFIDNEPKTIPRWAGILLLISVVIGGTVFHLHQERKGLRFEAELS